MKPKQPLQANLQYTFFACWMATETDPLAPPKGTLPIVDPPPDEAPLSHDACPRCHSVCPVRHGVLVCGACSFVGRAGRR